VSTYPELWSPVVGYEGRYQVSDHGRIRSLDSCMVLNPQKVKRGGYLRVGLRDADGRERKFFVHALVLEAFTGPRPAPPNHECRHWDGDPENNALENLRWGSATENARDRERHGTTARGERIGASKLTEQQVIELRTRAVAGELIVDISADLGISPSQASRIARGLKWAATGGEVVTSCRPLGERSHRAKLTDDEAEAIRSSTERTGVLAARYGVCRHTITNIRSGRSRVPAHWVGDEHLPMVPKSRQVRL
jgi:hypothetical protein